jgi:GT2 family glycosyltransferase
VQVIANRQNLGFAGANNQGIRASQGAYILLLNSDTIVPDGTLSTLLSYMAANPSVGAVSPRLVRPDGTPQPFAFGNDPTPGYLLRRTFAAKLLDKSLHDWGTDEAVEVDWVSGACMLVRREAIEQAGRLDEQMFMYFEDNEWCLRMRQKGWKIVYYPAVSIIHLGGQSLKQNPQAPKAYYASLRYFYRKHYGLLANFWLSLFLPIHQMLR